MPWPNQYLHLKVKAENVDALKGIKIRVADKNSQEMWATVGMSAVLIPWGETIAALSSGAVSGVSTSAVSGVDGKFWEFLKFFHATNHQWSSEIVAINNDTWKKIKPEHQKVIVELARKLEPEFWDSAFQADKDSSKKMIDSGMTAGRHLRGDDGRAAQAHRPSAGRLHEARAGLRDADQGLSRRNEAGMTHGHGGAPTPGRRRCCVRCSTASKC